MLSADVLHNIVKAATGTHHTAHQNAHAHNHSDSTAGIGYSNTLKTTDGSINIHYQAKETQSGYIGKACDCFKKLGGKVGDYPVSEQASGEIMALPI